MVALLLIPFLLWAAAANAQGYAGEAKYLCLSSVAPCDRLATSNELLGIIQKTLDNRKKELAVLQAQYSNRHPEVIRLKQLAHRKVGSEQVWETIDNSDVVCLHCKAKRDYDRHGPRGRSEFGGWFDGTGSVRWYFQFDSPSTPGPGEGPK